MVNFATGDSYEGERFNDKRNGLGRQEKSTGVYIGDFVEDRRIGKGRFLDRVKEEVYEGDWNNDKRNGEGTLIRRKTGEVLAGDFRNDHFEGKQRFERQLPLEDVERYFK